MTKANPVCLLVILHMLPPRANTPPPRAAYFELKKFAPPIKYNDYAKVSDTILKMPKSTMGPQLVKAHQVMPVGYQTTRLNQHLGIGRVVSKVHGLNAIQYHWKTLNGQHAPAPAPAPTSAPAPPPFLPLSPPLTPPQNVAADPTASILAILRPGGRCTNRASRG
ncbi:hypothetical protein L211DRAFT_853896 [Terfezia boudieri ATCC MYA-4762]|uniref:Uncharacterized protein n=1 Tax=Terfezia boudieri ATCC MYA-4762 TaxID=1051890 RepID=A0A3N4L756_9PEZI|nr:hypothetical protein L211DRAFT_853896 [Terfezia boudieri ATCC MYA-4762]